MNKIGMNHKNIGFAGQKQTTKEKAICGGLTSAGALAGGFLANAKFKTVVADTVTTAGKDIAEQAPVVAEGIKKGLVQVAKDGAQNLTETAKKAAGKFNAKTAGIIALGAGAGAIATAIVIEGVKKVLPETAPKA